MLALRKIFGDLRSAWGRALLLLIAVAVGQAVMTAAIDARTVLQREIDRDFAKANAPEMSIETGPIDAAELQALSRVQGVAALDIRTVVSARLRKPGGPWRPIVLFGVRDFQGIAVSRVFRDRGAWPPKDGEVLVERSGLGFLGAEAGTRFEVEAGSGHHGVLRLAGAVHDPALAPSWQEGTAYGYLSEASLAGIVGPGRPIQLQATTEAGSDPNAVAKALVEAVTKSGGRVSRVVVAPPKHPHADLMDTMLNLLSVFSALSFLLSLTLAGSIVASLTQRQERQFAVLRALGASGIRIGLIHLGFALIPAVLGVVAGDAIGHAGGRLLQTVMAGETNIDVADPSAGELLRWVLIGVGGAGVLAAALLPIAASVRKPVREALQPGTATLERSRLRLALLPPLDQLAVAEAFARPSRTLVAIVALSLGGAGLVTATSVYDSLVGVVDRTLEVRKDNLEIGLADGRIATTLPPKLSKIDGVQGFEFWDGRLVSILKRGVAAGGAPLFGLPGKTRMGLPPITAGRWPKTDFEIAVSGLLAGRGEAGIGQTLELSTPRGARRMKIVGLVDEFGESIWATPQAFAEMAEPSDFGRDLRLKIAPDKFARAAPEVEQAILDVGGFPKATIAKADRRAVMVNHFSEFYRLLLISALSAAVVGAIALSATVGSNVMERTREIGVLRAIGGRFRTLARLVLIQGLSLSLASLAVALALALPLSAVIVDALAKQALHLQMPLRLSGAAILGWAAASIAIAALAAIAPAAQMARLPIREAIAHE